MVYRFHVLICASSTLALACRGQRTKEACSLRPMRVQLGVPLSAKRGPLSALVSPGRGIGAGLNCAAARPSSASRAGRRRTRPAGRQPAGFFAEESTSDFNGYILNGNTNRTFNGTDLAMRTSEKRGLRSKLLFLSVCEAESGEKLFFKDWNWHSKDTNGIGNLVRSFFQIAAQIDKGPFCCTALNQCQGRCRAWSSSRPRTNACRCCAPKTTKWR